MKQEAILDALNLLEDGLIEEAGAVRERKKRGKRIWLKRAALAACLAGVVFAGGRAISRDGPGGTDALPILPVPQEISPAMGFEGYRAYDISELVSANPWNEALSLSSLPVCRNPIAYDENHIAQGVDLDKMRELALEIAAKLGQKADPLAVTGNSPSEEAQRAITEKMGGNVPEGYFNPTQLRLQTEDFDIRVDQNLTADIRLQTPVSLPSEYRFTHSASLEELNAAAEYLQDAYRELIGGGRPRVNLCGGDYSIDGLQRYDIEFFDSSGSPAEQIVNYNFNRTAFYCDDDGKLYLIRVYRPDLSQKVGDYPIISAEEARRLLSQGHYITSVPWEIPGDEYVARAELVYRGGAEEEFFMPYYRFYVELPEREAEDGMKIYGAYYVPAVEGRFLSGLPVWDGGFN